MHEIGAHQPTLLLCEARMGVKRLFHLIGARFECLEQIAMAALKVFADFGQLTSSRCRIERQDSIHDMICARLVRGVEIARFSRRLEWTDDHSCRVRAQIKTLPVENLDGNYMSFEMESPSLTGFRHAKRELTQVSCDRLPYAQAGESRSDSADTRRRIHRPGFR